MMPKTTLSDRFHMLLGILGAVVCVPGWALHYARLVARLSLVWNVTSDLSIRDIRERMRDFRSRALGTPLGRELERLEFRRMELEFEIGHPRLALSWRRVDQMLRAAQVKPEAVQVKQEILREAEKTRRMMIRYYAGQRVAASGPTIPKESTYAN